MKIKYALLYIIVMVSSLSCTPDDENPRKPRNILVVGNSILRHPPAPGIGWYGDWGMAASSPDKDFIHQFTARFKAYPEFVVNSQNITFWENDFNYDLELYANLAGKNYELIIVRLGENVTDLPQYQTALREMIKHFSNKDTKVIITGLIWENPDKEEIHREVALAGGYTFVSLEEFRTDSQKYSWGMYGNGAVAAHPSDLGMTYLSDLLYDAAEELLIAK